MVMTKPVDAGSVPKLCDAGYVGQLVLASSPESRYVCVMVTPMLKVAARILAAQTSIRVEAADGGTMPSTMCDSLAVLGFGVSSNKLYASVHYQFLASHKEAVMSLAAQLAALAFAFKIAPTSSVATIPDLCKLPGMGV